LAQRSLRSAPQVELNGMDGFSCPRSVFEHQVAHGNSGRGWSAGAEPMSIRSCWAFQLLFQLPGEMVVGRAFAAFAVASPAGCHGSTLFQISDFPVALPARRPRTELFRATYVELSLKAAPTFRRIRDRVRVGALGNLALSLPHPGHLSLSLSAVAKNSNSAKVPIASPTQALSTVNPPSFYRFFQSVVLENS